MTVLIAVSIEHTPRKTFASAVDWPGWCRSGKTAELALETLATEAARYALVAEAAGFPLGPAATVDDLEVVERNDGAAGSGGRDTPRSSPG